MRKTIFLLTIASLLLIGGLVGAQDSAALVTHGPTSGEVSAEGVTLWARGSEAGTLLFEVAPNADFREIVMSAEVEVVAETDFTGEAILSGLAPATDYAYRVSLNGGEAKTGSFRTAPPNDEQMGFSFAFASCLGGQGYCRTEEGWVIFDTIQANAPDFFLFTGDTVYSSNECAVDGGNLPGSEAGVATLEGFYERNKYHLEDPIYADFLANTPVYVTWDDHEIFDNFGGPSLQRVNPQLFQEGRQAFFDYWPIHGTEADPYQLYRQVPYGAHADFFILDTRSYRDPMVNWDPSPVNGQHKTMLGAEQFAWLQSGLAESEATWKFIVTSVPLAYPTGFPQPQVDGRDGWADGPDRTGYETELMRLLFFIEAQDIQNVIFISGDTHWPFAHSYDPDLDGLPNFYEFSASPLSAIPLAPTAPDQTFNPTVLYAEGEFMGDLFNFGEVIIGDAGDLTFRVVDREGNERFSTSLLPE